MDERQKLGIRQATKLGYIYIYIGGVADLSYPTSELRRGRVQKDGKAAPTITTTSGVCKILGKEQIKLANVEDYLVNDFGVFKLSPRECGRLMGVNDRDIDKMFSVNSNTQCYKQYGNSIVVPVLMAIFSQLGLKGVPKWNDLSEEEKCNLVEKDFDFMKGGDPK